MSDELRTLAEDILEWSKAYPVNIFSEPTPEQVDAVCKTVGCRIDNITAMILRQYTKRWGERAEKALAELDAPLSNAYTPEQIEQAIKHLKQLEKLGAEYMNQDRYHALTILAALEAAESYAAKLEKAGDDMRESSDGSILHCDAIRDWDAARKEKP